MFNHIYKDPCVIKIHQETPLYWERIDFLKPLLDKGYTVKSLQTVENLLMSIVKYPNHQTGQTININKATDIYSHNKKSHTRMVFISTATIWLKKLTYIPKSLTKTTNQIWVLHYCKKYALKIGKQFPAVLQKQVSPHTIRHTTAT